jgi:hypothetical protein
MKHTVETKKQRNQNKPDCYVTGDALSDVYAETVQQKKGSLFNKGPFKYSARRLMGSRLIESAT